jgi:hypothetical protein
MDCSLLGWDGLRDFGERIGNCNSMLHRVMCVNSFCATRCLSAVDGSLRTSESAGFREMAYSARMLQVKAEENIHNRT